MLRFSYRSVALVAYCVLLLPSIVFFFGWLRWYWAVPATVLLVAGLVWLYRRDYLVRRDAISIPAKHFVPIVLIVMFYVAFSGNCGIGFGGYDIPWRDALLHDMIDFEWPVYYSTGAALCYYQVFWMVPALVGKAFGWVGACIVMGIQETIIIVDALLLIFGLLGSNRPAHFWMVTTVFLLWCGLNIFGAAISHVVGFHPFEFSYNMEYAGRFEFRCNLDCIQESYNQIVVWLAIPLMLGNRKIHSFLFLALLILPFSPWVFAGLIPFMVVLGVVELRGYAKALKAGMDPQDAGAQGLDARSTQDTGARGKGAHSKKRALPTPFWALREVFSPANTVALIVCGVVFGSWFVAALQPGSYASGEAGAGGAGLVTFGYLGPKKLAGFVIFAICQYGIFAALLFRKHKKDPVYWTMIAWLTIAPFIWVGQYMGNDFCMDATLTGTTVLMIMMMDLVQNDIMGKPRSLRGALTIVLLVIAMAAPVMQLGWYAQNLIEARSLHVVRQSTEITTYEGLPLEKTENFVCPEPEDTFFFTTLSR